MGLSLSIVPIFVFPWKTEFDQTTQSFMHRGFLFKTSENLTSSRSGFKIFFTNINCEKGTADCKIIANPFLIDFSNYTSAFFLLQIPFNISNVQVEYLAGEPAVFGGNSSTDSAGNMSYIFVSLPKNQNHVREHFEDAGHFTLTYTFTVESAFAKINSYTYEFPITWGGGINNAYQEFDYLKRILPDLHWDFYFFNATNAPLYVERSAKYYYSQVLPRLDRIEVVENRTSYYWDLEQIGAKGRESSIIIEIMNLSAKNRHELSYSLVWLLFGIGIPLTVSSVIEFLKNEGKVKLWKCLCCIIGGLVVGVLTYLLLEYVVVTWIFLS